MMFNCTRNFLFLVSRKTAACLEFSQAVTETGFLLTMGVTFLLTCQCFWFLGRDGFTHNMLDNIHAHWKRRRVCKIKCKGVCTVDMENVRQQLEVRRLLGNTHT